MVSPLDLESRFDVMKQDPIPYIVSKNAENAFITQNRPSLVQELLCLCIKTHYREKQSFFYKSLLYLDIILHEAQTYPNESFNYSLLCLNALSLGIKFTQNQIDLPRISQLKSLDYKFESYSLDECLANETLCVKFMNFRLVYSSCYDYLEMFLAAKTALFDKAKELLERIICEKLFIQKHPYFIASYIVSHCFDSLVTRDIRLQQRFFCDRNNQFYLRFVNIINNHKINEKEDMSLLASEKFSPSSTSEENYGSQREKIREKYTKIRQKSKNIEMIRTSELKQLMEITQACKPEEDLEQKISEDESIKVKKLVRRDLKQVKEHSKKSCINVFTSSIKIYERGSELITQQNNHNNLQEQKSACNNRVVNVSSLPQSRIFNCLSDKKVNRNINLDLKTVARFNIRQVLTFNTRRSNEVE